MSATVSKARHSYGTTLGIDPAGGTSFQIIAEVQDMDGPGIKVTTTERTNLNSPFATKEKIPGFVDAGQLKLKLNFTEAGYALFLGWLRKSLMGIQITYPLVGTQSAPATLTGYGHIGEIGETIPEDDRITVDVTLEASGASSSGAGTIGGWVFQPGSPEN